MTINITCTSLTVNSSEFVNTNQQVNFKLYKNCSSTASLNFTPPLLPVTNTVYTTSALGLDFTTGVWEVVATITKQDGSILILRSCYFVDCDETRCKILPDYISQPTKALAYEALLASNTCSQCSCSSMCSFNNLLTSTCDGCACTKCSV